MYLFHSIDGNDADNGGAGFLGFANDFFDDFERHEGPNRIVNGNELGVLIDSGQSVFDRILARFTTFHGAHGFRKCLTAKELFSPRQVVGSERDNNLGDRWGTYELADGVEENRRAVEQHELLSADAFLLWRAPAHARSQARGGNNNGDLHEYTSDVKAGTYMIEDGEAWQGHFTERTPRFSLRLAENRGLIRRILRNERLVWGLRLAEERGLILSRDGGLRNEAIRQ